MRLPVLRRKRQGVHASCGTALAREDTRIVNNACNKYPLVRA